MKRMGICMCCNEYKLVQDHHWHGYTDKHKDDVIPYCQSCDLLAHNKAKKNGKCNLNHNEVKKKTHASCQRRNGRTKTFSETIIKNIQIFILIRVYKSTENININSCFVGNHGKKLYYMKEVL